MKLDMSEKEVKKQQKSDLLSPHAKKYAPLLLSSFYIYRHRALFVTVAAKKTFTHIKKLFRFQKKPLY